MRVLATAVKGVAEEEKLTCSLSVPPDFVNQGRVITKRLVVEGSAGSGVTINCNGGIIDGARFPQLAESKPNKRNMILITSTGSGDITDGGWARPTDVTVKNCTIIGGVRVQSVTDQRILETSSGTARHTMNVQRVAPTRITLDNLKVVAREWVPVYFEIGVTDSKLVNSEVIGETKGPNVYLDAESSRNTIKNSYIHAVTPREVLAIDGSSSNKIINNRFSALSHGGIYLYRNCGERGLARHQSPTGNEIINNVFYYDDYFPLPWEVNPSVFLGSRNGDDDDLLWWDSPLDGFCEQDEHHAYGSANSDLDYARHNVVMQNQVYKLPLDGWMIKEGRSTDKPNYIKYNTTVSTHVERRAGCYVPLQNNIYNKDFILDGESIGGFTCQDGDLKPK